MPNSLQPLPTLGNGSANQISGLTPDAYEAARRRQVMADALVADAKSPTGAGGSLFGAIGQGLKGYAGASMQQQNAAALAPYASVSPQAVNSLQPSQPFTLPNPAAAIGTFFNGIGSVFGGDSPSASQPGFLTPDPDNRAAASVSSTPVIGAGLPWDDRDG